MRWELLRGGREWAGRKAAGAWIAWGHLATLLSHSISSRATAPLRAPPTQGFREQLVREKCVDPTCTVAKFPCRRQAPASTTHHTRQDLHNRIV